MVRFSLPVLLIFFFLIKLSAQRNLAVYSPWGGKRVRHDLVTKQQQRQHLSVLPEYESKKHSS